MLSHAKSGWGLPDVVSVGRCGFEPHIVNRDGTRRLVPNELRDGSDVRLGDRKAVPANLLEEGIAAGRDPQVHLVGGNVGRARVPDTVLHINEGRVAVHRSVRPVGDLSGQGVGTGGVVAALQKNRGGGGRVVADRDGEGVGLESVLADGNVVGAAFDVGEGKSAVRIGHERAGGGAGGHARPGNRIAGVEREHAAVNVAATGGAEDFFVASGEEDEAEEEGPEKQGRRDGEAHCEGEGGNVVSSCHVGPDGQN